jgi:hypothetical protein
MCVRVDKGIFKSRRRPSTIALNQQKAGFSPSSSTLVDENFFLMDKQ